MELVERTLNDKVTLPVTGSNTSESDVVLAHRDTAFVNELAQLYTEFVPLFVGFFTRRLGDDGKMIHYMLFFVLRSVVIRSSQDIRKHVDSARINLYEAEHSLASRRR